MTKHGIHIREHKRWNTKTVYNRGHVMRIYRRQPKALKFESPMVNDFNQHLCGGWGMPEVGDVGHATIDQLVNKRKPFASITYFAEQKDAAMEAVDRLADAGLVGEVHRRRFSRPGWKEGYVWDVLAAQDIRVCDIGDMEALIADYTPVLGEESARTQIEYFADHQLEDFFDGWDTPPLPCWLTGLILGYPIENTISIYMEGNTNEPLRTHPREQGRSGAAEG